MSNKQTEIPMATEVIGNQIKEEKPKKIFLSLDGGGVRGLMSIQILEDIENQLGKAIGDVCDVIGGTSAGGIISCAKMNKMTTKELYDRYKSLCKFIFTKSLSNITESQSLANTDKVLDELNAMFGPTTKLSEFATTRKGFVTTCLAKSKFPINFTPMMLSNYDNEFREFIEPKKMIDITVVDAVRATFAIPILFKTPKFQGKYFLDGGYISNNNPINLTYKEALSLYGGDNSKEFVFISIGTGKKTKSLKQKLIDQFENGLDKIESFTGVEIDSPFHQFMEFMSYSGEDVHKKFKADHPDFNYFRFDTPIDKVIALNEADDKTIDYMNKATTDYINSDSFKETLSALKVALP